MGKRIENSQGSKLTFIEIYCLIWPLGIGILKMAAWMDLVPIQQPLMGGDYSCYQNSFWGPCLSPGGVWGLEAVQGPSAVLCSSWTNWNHSSAPHQIGLQVLWEAASGPWIDTNSIAVSILTSWNFLKFYLQLGAVTSSCLGYLLSPIQEWGAEEMSLLP